MSFDELHAIIMQRESARVEFKAEASDEVLRGFATDLAAMANSQGGIIIFGVRDNLDPAGCDLTGKERDRISQEAANCRPAVVGIDFEEVPFGKRRFLVVHVPRSAIVHSDPQRKFPVRTGNVTEYLDAPALIILLQERLALDVEAPASIVLHGQPTVEMKRGPIPEDRAAAMIELLRDERPEVRIEAARDFAGQVYRYEIFANRRLADTARAMLENGEEEEKRAVLQALRFAAQAGTAVEQAAAQEFMPVVSAIFISTNSPNLATMCLQPLIYTRNPAVVDALVHLVKDASEAVYAAAQPQFYAQDIRSYGIDTSFRAALYSLLKQGPDDRIRKRISESLAAIRF